MGIRVVDQHGNEVDNAALVDLLEPLVERYLGELEILSPLVVQVPPKGGAWLYAYVDPERGLRVHFPAGLLAELKSLGATNSVRASVATRVRDLAANLRSREGSPAQYFRRATRTLPVDEREPDS